MVETVFSAQLPVHESLLVQKRRIVGQALAQEAGLPANATSAKEARHPEVLEQAPRLAVVTGIHGDELEGQYVAYQLGRILDASRHLLTGIVDIYPAVNPLGINSIERGVPGYDLDLNRVFPGNADGGLTDALAAAVIEDIAGAAACVDIHASNIFLREMPQVRINELTAATLVPLAHFLNIDFVWVHASATVLQSTLAYSLNAIGIPTLVVETGVGMRLTPHENDRLTQGLLRLAHHLGIWQGPFEVCGLPVISHDGHVHFLNAEAAGIFIQKARHGRRIGKGELIGLIVNPLTGAVCQEVRCPASGLLFTLREYPVVYPGSLLARVLGEEPA